jgi:hypothetical protein
VATEWQSGNKCVTGRDESFPAKSSDQAQPRSSTAGGAEMTSSGEATARLRRDERAVGDAVFTITPKQEQVADYERNAYLGPVVSLIGTGVCTERRRPVKVTDL